MILLSYYSRVRMTVKEGASAQDHEEYRESMRLKVHQGNGIVSRRVERLQDGVLEVATRDRIESSTSRSSKPPTVKGNEDSQPRCMCIVQIGQSNSPIAERDVLDKVGNHMRPIREPEGKRVNEF